MSAGEVTNSALETLGLCVESYLSQILASEERDPEARIGNKT